MLGDVGGPGLVLVQDAGGRPVQSRQLGWCHAVEHGLAEQRVLEVVVLQAPDEPQGLEDAFDVDARLAQ